MSRDNPDIYQYMKEKNKVYSNAYSYLDEVLNLLVKEKSLQIQDLLFSFGKNGNIPDISSNFGKIRKKDEHYLALVYLIKNDYITIMDNTPIDKLSTSSRVGITFKGKIVYQKGGFGEIDEKEKKSYKADLFFKVGMPIATIATLIATICLATCN